MQIYIIEVYYTIYTLFSRNGLGVSEDLDCIDGLMFEKQVHRREDDILWVSKNWGCIELPRLQVVQ